MGGSVIYAVAPTWGKYVRRIMQMLAFYCVLYWVAVVVFIYSHQGWAIPKNTVEVTWRSTDIFYYEEATKRKWCRFCMGYIVGSSRYYDLHKHICTRPSVSYHAIFQFHSYLSPRIKRLSVQILQLGNKFITCVGWCFDNLKHFVNLISNVSKNIDWLVYGLTNKCTFSIHKI